MLTAERLHDLMIYDRDTGEFFWRNEAGRHGRIAAGTRAGYLHEGYRFICIDGQDIRAHHLAWLYVYGRWPEGKIDHRDLDRTNNAISNLRLATTSQNGANRRMQKNNMSGIKGASWYAPLRKWRASIKHNGKVRHLGYFDHKQEAGAAYESAAKEFFGEFSRTA